MTTLAWLNGQMFTDEVRFSIFFFREGLALLFLEHYEYKARRTDSFLLACVLSLLGSLAATPRKSTGIPTSHPPLPLFQTGDGWIFFFRQKTQMELTHPQLFLNYQCQPFLCWHWHPHSVTLQLYSSMKMENLERVGKLTAMIHSLWAYRPHSGT